MPPRARTRYTDEQRRIVALEYSTCRTPQEKLALCKKVGIPDIRRLYNLACQMGLTRGSEDLSDAEFRQFVAGNKSVMSLRRRYDSKDEERLLAMREEPSTTEFTAEDDKFIITNYGRMSIVNIALARQHSETAILYRARQLKRQKVDADGNLLPPRPLRRPAVGYPIHRVAKWLGLSEDEVKDLRRVGVQVRPLLNRRGEIQDYWVISRTLAPFLREYGVRLAKDKGADLFFIREIIEGEAETEQRRQELRAARAAVMTANETGDEVLIERARIDYAELVEELKDAGQVEESCYFLDHGAKCSNPWAGPCYGLFCDGEDPKCRVKDAYLTFPKE